MRSAPHRFLVAFAILAGCGRMGFDVTGWWDEGFTRRNEIDVLGTKLLESESDFPLLVRLEPPEFDLQAMRSDGADLRFVAADGATTLPYEIEQITATGVSVWVHMPLIRGRTIDELVWVYYGNPAASPDLRNEQVWSAELTAVWHMGSDGRDATSNHIDGTFTGTVEVPGIAGDARDMQNGWLAVALSATLGTIGANGTATWSAWFNPHSNPAGASVTTLIGRQTDTTGHDDFRFGSTPSGMVEGELAVDPGTQTVDILGGQIDLGRWQLIALVRDGSDVHLVVDGVTRAMMTSAGTIHASANPILIGADCNGCGLTPNSDFVDGLVDEVRIESVARTDGWLTAEVLDLNGGLVTVQPFEPL
jgi:biopolymer transport protein ExbB